ncbi:MAG: hypothetical protein GX238_04700 [Epulopiscium sp.]|nr:hypothetical protein [Candidatus Epulonipiscium sp.]
MLSVTVPQGLESYFLGKETKTPIYWFYQYCKVKHPFIFIHEVDQELFYQFFLYWLPKESNCMNFQKAQILLEELQYFWEYVFRQTGVNLSSVYLPIVNELEEEFLRIMQVQYELKRSIGHPIVNIDPLIIDLIGYKKLQARKKERGQGMIFEQGYFEMIDVVDQYGVILKKKWSPERYVKILVDPSIRQLLRKGDLLHMRLRRKLFFTCWDMEEIKSCYLPQAQEYLSQK